MSHAYLQLQLDKESQKYATTHKGLYQYTRQPFGVSSACALFQRTMENILQGLPQVAICLDGVLITRKTKKEHLENLDVVLKLNYYGKFIHNLASILAPLHLLLKKGQLWKWSRNQEAAFREVKKQLSSSKESAYYDSELAHWWPNGDKHPIAYAFCTLAAQIKKEGLVVIFNMRKFHQHLYGWEFVRVTHRKRLLGPMKEDKAVPPIASGRIWNWVLNLSAYTKTFEKLRASFAIYGLPEGLITDNGMSFTSREFEYFLKSNSIRHIRTAPYHPWSNGLADR
eukprot:g47606.t1